MWVSWLIWYLFNKHTCIFEPEKIPPLWSYNDQPVATLLTNCQVVSWWHYLPNDIYPAKCQTTVLQKNKTSTKKFSLTNCHKDSENIFPLTSATDTVLCTPIFSLKGSKQTNWHPAVWAVCPSFSYHGNQVNEIQPVNGDANLCKNAVLPLNDIRPKTCRRLES